MLHVMNERRLAFIEIAFVLHLRTCSSQSNSRIVTGNKSSIMLIFVYIEWPYLLNAQNILSLFTIFSCVTMGIRFVQVSKHALYKMFGVTREDHCEG